MAAPEKPQVFHYGFDKFDTKGDVHINGRSDAPTVIRGGTLSTSGNLVIGGGLSTGQGQQFTQGPAPVMHLSNAAGAAAAAPPTYTATGETCIHRSWPNRPLFFRSPPKDGECPLCKRAKENPDGAKTLDMWNKCLVGGLVEVQNAKGEWTDWVVHSKHRATYVIGISSPGHSENYLIDLRDAQSTLPYIREIEWHAKVKGLYALYIEPLLACDTQLNVCLRWLQMNESFFTAPNLEDAIVKFRKCGKPFTWWFQAALGAEKGDISDWKQLCPEGTLDDPLVQCYITAVRYSNWTLSSPEEKKVYVAKGMALLRDVPTPSILTRGDVVSFYNHKAERAEAKAAADAAAAAQPAEMSDDGGARQAAAPQPLVAHTSVTIGNAFVGAKMSVHTAAPQPGQCAPDGTPEAPFGVLLNIPNLQTPALDVNGKAADAKAATALVGVDDVVTTGAVNTVVHKYKQQCTAEANAAVIHYRLATPQQKPRALQDMLVALDRLVEAEKALALVKH